METVVINKQSWTILALVNWGAEYLSQRHIESPRLTTELLLSHVLGCSRIDLYTRYDQPLTGNELSEFKSCFKRRLAHEPLQYIIGQTDFMGLSFAVDRRVLIPRQETEILVEYVSSLCRRSDSEKIMVLDIGTGSGNIAISLAKANERVFVDAIDSSSEALEVARHNLQLYKCEHRIELFHADVLQDMNILADKHYNFIVSNPPYISLKEFATVQPEVKQYEPATALTDHADGLTFFKAIAGISHAMLLEAGEVVVEIAYNQSSDVQKIFAEAGFSEITSFRDYDGNERVVRARR